MEVRRYHRAIAVLALAYLLLETLYVIRLPLVTDEFDGAYEAYRVRRDVPYRDYTPYKTVLGYYIEAIPSLAGGDVWSRILSIKLALVAINAAMLLWAATMLLEFARGRAVVASLGLLVVNSNFLERSAELRVDMLTGWAGLVSLIFLVGGRFSAAGAACAISFLISQKGAFYVIAAVVATAVAFLFERRHVAGMRAVARFSAAFAAVIAAYIAFWSALASPAKVLVTMFQAAAGQALTTFYDIRALYWTQTAMRNPVWLVLPLIAAAMLLWRRQNLLVSTYAIVVYAAAAAYRQPWPYFFPLLWPTFFVLLAFFFATVPLRRAAVVAIAVAGVLLPLMRLPAVLRRDNAYQRYNVAIASSMLGPRDTYIAGTDIIHDHEQAVPRLERLDARMLTLLSRESGGVLKGIVGEIAQRPPKLLIGTYRVYGMPRPLLEYFDRDYVRLTASILGYAPRLEAGTTNRRLAFGGRYRIDSPKPQVVTIDGRPLRSGDAIELASGVHTISALLHVRLRLLPDAVEQILDPAFVDERPFYVDPYGY